MPASEERSISQFPSALNILATTLLLVSTYDSGNDTYDSEKVSAVDLASAILGDFEYTQDLATNVKTIFGAINSIMVLSGTTVPTSQIGSNGQLYVKYTSSGGTDTVDGLYWKINNAWVEISTGGGGGASVTLGTTVPSDASGSNGDLYVQYDGTTYEVIEYYVKINNAWRKAPYSRVVALTQAEYDLITPDPSTLYIITDAQGSYLKFPVITDAYDATSTYAVGDLCIYDDALYKCTTAITTAEAWNADHWTQTSIANEIGRIDTALEPLTKVKEQILYYSNGARIWVKRLGNTVQVEINESSQMTFSTSWTNVYTDNTYQTRAYLDSDLIGTANTLYVPIGLVNGHQIILRIEKTNRAIQIICDVNIAIYPQGSGVYTLA